MTATLAFILAYMLAQLGIGVWISRRIKSESDYLIAGRSLGYVLATFSIFATWFGAETIMGSAGAAYSSGISLRNAEPFGYALCLILMGLVFAVPLWRLRLTTLADLFRTRYSATVERVASIILIPSSVLWAAAQVRGFGTILSAASPDWSVDVAIGCAALFTIAYTMFGGLLVDAITDVVQGILVVVGLVILFVAVAVHAGGFSSMIAHAGAHSMPVEAAPISGLALLEEWSIPVLGSVVATELVGRVIATRTHSVARNTPLLAGACYLLVGLVPLTLGAVGGALGFQLADPEQVVPVLARELLPTALYAAFAAAVISAVLSTVDSTLLTASGLLSHNLIVPIARVRDERMKVLIARGGVLAFGIIAYVLALTANGVFELVERASALGSSGSLVVVCFGLFTRYGGPAAALTTLLAGTFTYLAGGAITEYPFLLSLVVSIVTYVLVALLETRTAAARVTWASPNCLDPVRSR